jgi:hypothetical protein
MESNSPETSVPNWTEETYQEKLARFSEVVHAEDGTEEAEEYNILYGEILAYETFHYGEVKLWKNENDIVQLVKDGPITFHPQTNRRADEIKRGKEIIKNKQGGDQKGVEDGGTNR